MSVEIPDELGEMVENYIELLKKNTKKASEQAEVVLKKIQTSYLFNEKYDEEQRNGWIDYLMRNEIGCPLFSRKYKPQERSDKALSISLSG
ncbi:MAG: hypothetical protein GTN76_01755 [Candidatus Aenigmarchaeota archaeon]|nr:hypothetical protein [Candidatus Aenigmarchaeota archaeon]